MSKLQSFWETEFFITYKGKKHRVSFLEEYYDAVPRSLPDERRLLKEDIHEYGFNEPIKVSIEGMVLDGHTRIEIGEEVGWKKLNGEPLVPKFEIKEFPSKKEERDYVIKTNLMRRQLNAFQRVRLVAKLYNNNPHSRQEQTRYDVLLELNKGKPMNANQIGAVIGMHKGNVLKVLRGLKEDFCVNYKEVQEELHKTRQPTHFYHILPKGEGILYKGRPEAVTLKRLGRSIGVGRDMVSRAIYLLEHANSNTLLRLEKGNLGIMKAYLDLTRPEKVKNMTSYTYLRGSTKVICPYCEKIATKNDWKVFNDGE